MIMVWPGEEKAWDILVDLDAKDVTVNAKALFNSYDSTYALTCFGQDVCISLKDRIIWSTSMMAVEMMLMNTKVAKKGVGYVRKA
jgi:hypothetical protein